MSLLTKNEMLFAQGIPELSSSSDSTSEDDEVGDDVKRANEKVVDKSDADGKMTISKIINPAITLWTQSSTSSTGMTHTSSTIVGLPVNASSASPTTASQLTAATVAGSSSGPQSPPQNLGSFWASRHSHHQQLHRSPGRPAVRPFNPQSVSSSNTPFYARADNHYRTGSTSTQPPVNNQVGAIIPPADSATITQSTSNQEQQKEGNATNPGTDKTSSSSSEEPPEAEPIRSRLRRRPLPPKTIYRYDNWSGPSQTTQQRRRGRQKTQPKTRKTAGTTTQTERSSSQANNNSRVFCPDTGGSGSRHASSQGGNVLTARPDSRRESGFSQMTSFPDFPQSRVDPFSHCCHHSARSTHHHCAYHSRDSHFDDEPCSHCGRVHRRGASITSAREHSPSFSPTSRRVTMPNISRFVHTTGRNSPPPSSSSLLENQDSPSPSSPGAASRSRNIPSIRHLEQRLIRIENLLFKLTDIMEKVTGENVNEVEMKGEEDDASHQAPSQKATKTRKKGGGDSSDESGSSDSSDSSGDDRKKRKKKDEHRHKKKKRKTKTPSHSGKKCLHRQESFKPRLSSFVQCVFMNSGGNDEKMEEAKGGEKKKKKKKKKKKNQSKSSRKESPSDSCDEKSKCQVMTKESKRKTEVSSSVETHVPSDTNTDDDKNKIDSKNHDQNKEKLKEIQTKKDVADVGSKATKSKGADEIGEDKSGTAPSKVVVDDKKSDNNDVAKSVSFNIPIKEGANINKDSNATTNEDHTISDEISIIASKIGGEDIGKGSDRVNEALTATSEKSGKGKGTNKEEGKQINDKSRDVAEEKKEQEPAKKERTKESDEQEETKEGGAKTTSLTVEENEKGETNAQKTSETITEDEKGEDGEDGSSSSDGSSGSSSGESDEEGESSSSDGTGGSGSDAEKGEKTDDGKIEGEKSKGENLEDEKSAADDDSTGEKDVEKGDESPIQNGRRQSTRVIQGKRWGESSKSSKPTRKPHCSHIVNTCYYI